MLWQSVRPRHKAAALCVGVNSNCDRDVLSSRLSQHSIHEFRPSFGIAKLGGDAEDLQFGALERERHREGVVDVVTDVGIDNDLLERRTRRLTERDRAQKKSKNN